MACLSSQSVGRVGFVQNEFRIALSALGSRPSGTTFLIPVRLDECNVPDLQVPDLGLSLRDIHWVNLWEEGAFDRLVRALENALKKPNEALPQPDRTVQLPLGVIPDRAPDIIRSDDDGIEELFCQPISEKTLSYYTRWKYPGRSIDHAAQGRLLEDLAYSHFKTIQDLDSAIDAAVDAVDHHRKENPNTFQTGTDFLIMSLGFVDTGFRARHRFSSQTRKAFSKYEHLIKSAEAHKALPDERVIEQPGAGATKLAQDRVSQTPTWQERMVAALVVGALGGGASVSGEGINIFSGLFWLIAGAVSGVRRHGTVGIIIGSTVSLLMAWIFDFDDGTPSLIGLGGMCGAIIA